MVWIRLSEDVAEIYLHDKKLNFELALPNMYDEFHLRHSLTNMEQYWFSTTETQQ